MARVFISHAGADAAWSDQVHRWLSEAGHEIFLDQNRDDGILPGEEWEKRLYSELSKADAVVCVVTAAYLSSVWCAAEIGAARALGAELLPVQFSSDGARHTLLKPLQGLDAATDPEEARERLLSRLSVIDGGGGRGWPDDRSPYPGLRPFDLGDHRVYFGRTREITQITERLRSPERATPTILTVVGPSGCGKSSLVRAGVIPRITDGKDWLPIPPIVPGTDPLGNLARALAALKRERRVAFDVTSLRKDIQENGLHSVATDFLIAAEADSQCKLLVVIDQFEELLTQTEPEARAEFVDMLGPALGGPIQALATLRPEFLDPIAKDPHLSKLALRMRQIRPLESDALRTVIEKPAKVAGFSFDDDLVTQLVADTGDGSALPLLAYTLEQLAEGVKRGGRLTHQRYAEIGGVRGALQRQADAALAEACSTTGAAPEHVISSLLSLVTIDEAGRPAKRRGELDEFASSAAELEPFIARRLLSTYSEDEHTFVAAAHDAFLVNWTPLAQEIDKQASALRTRRVVENAANDWVAGGRDTAGLLTGPQLAKATVNTGAELKARSLVTQVSLNDTAREFLETSIRTDRTRRRRRTLLAAAAIATLTAVAGVAVIGFVRAGDERDNARTSARQATAARLTQESAEMLSGNKPGGDVRALYELLAANTLTPSTAQGEMLNAVLQRLSTAKIIPTASSVVEVAFSADGARMATGGTDGTLKLWDVESGRAVENDPIPALSESQRILSLAFRATELRVATRNQYNEVQVWNAENRSPVGPTLRGYADLVEAAALSPDGHRLATGSADGAVQIRTADTGALLGVVNHGERVFALAFSRDGRLLATGGADDTVRLWNADTGQPVTTLTGIRGVRSLAFNATADRLAIGDTENTVQVTDIRTGESVDLTGHTYWVQAVTFSPDGRYLASGSADGTVRLWNLDAGQPLRISYDPALAGVVLSPDGRLLATGEAPGTMRLWNAESGAAVPLHGSAVGAITAAFSPDDQLLAAGYADGAVRLFDTSSGDETATLTGHEKPVGSVAFSADGKLLAGASTDDTVRIWNVDERRTLHTLTDTGPVTSMAFSPDGRRLATGGRGTVRLWDTDAGEPIGNSPAVHDELVLAVAFSPDGQYVAGAGDDQKVGLWSADTGQPVRRFEIGHTGSIRALAYSPDGNLLATGSTDATVRLWNIATGLPVGDQLKGHTDGVGSVAFSSDGNRLISAGTDKTIRTWPAIATPQMLCDKLTADITEPQWRQWISPDPDIGYQPLCQR